MFQSIHGELVEVEIAGLFSNQSRPVAEAEDTTCESPQLFF